MENRILKVVSTSRNIRDFYAKNSDKNTLLPSIITIGEFEKKAVLVRDLKRADEINQILIMQRAIKSVKNTGILGISGEFFVFLKNHNYIFSFFKELKREKVDIESLKNSDIYAHYDEHLTILQELQNEYLKLLKGAEFYDEISVCDSYEINDSFINNFDEIYIKIDGILSNFTWEILEKISVKKRLIIAFTASKYNQKLIKKIATISGLNFEIDNFYEINLTQKTIINAIKILPNNSVKIRDFSLRSLQGVYVFDEISRFTRAGIDPKNIAVILPDASFYEILENLDENNMLNFAMGKSLRKHEIFAILSTLKSALDAKLKYKFNENYLTHSFNLNSDIAALNFYKIPSEIYAKFAKFYNDICDFDDFKNLINLITEIFLKDDQILVIFDELFYLFKNLLENLPRPERLKFCEIFELFLIEISRKNTPIVGGGEVTVMEILESRAQNYDGVIIVDFNEDLVPRPSQKEMFLSSQIRAKVGLISHAERENLQRFYYESLINSAKFVSVCYLNDDEHGISRFGLDFLKNNEYDEIAYYSALNATGGTINMAQKEITIKHDFFAQPLSFTRLDTFLNCRRKYFYKYIQKVGEYRNFGVSQTANEFGNIIHDCLKEYFLKNCDHFNKSEFMEIFKEQKERLSLFNYEYFVFLLNNFEKTQNEHFNKGYKIFACESEILSEFGDIKLTGKIDRIDKQDIGDGFLLIDYKTGKADNKSMQLPFYQLLCEREFGKCEAKFYEFPSNSFIDFKENKNNKETPIDTLKNTLLKLQNELKSGEICFERNTKECEYCDYKIFCLKDF